jgi:hypothetical protein
MKFPIVPTPWPDGEPSDQAPGPTCFRWESAGGLWRVQVDPVLFGYRVHVDRGWPLDSLDAAPIGDGPRHRWPCHEVGYCCGANRLALMLVPRLVMKILEPFDEGARVDEVRRAFPQQHRKPIENDPECWTALCAVAGMPEASDLFYALELNRDTLRRRP